jgi:outer membrane protein OmpA-like peptidoglycan-associated protein
MKSKIHILFTAATITIAGFVQAQTTDTIIEVNTSAADTMKSPATDLVKAIEEEKQAFCKHEFSIWTAGGFAALNYKSSLGKRTLKSGGTFGMGYTYYFHPKWGIHTGAEIAVYNTIYRLRSLKDKYTRYGFDDLTPGWSGEDELIDYHTELSNYKEKQQQYNLNIPLMLQFQTPLAGGSHQFFAMSGAKLGVPIQSTYRANTTLYTWYYDYKSNQEFRPDPTDYGTPWLEDLGCFYNKSYSTGNQENKFKIAGLASAEAGVKWRLSQKLSLYTGAYFDYGFNNIKNRNGNRFFEFDPMEGYMISNSILTSQHAHNGRDVGEFAKRVSPMAFGIKVRLGITMCEVEKNRKRKQVAQYPNANDLFDAYRKGFRDGCKDCVEVCKECSKTTSCCCEHCRVQPNAASENNLESSSTTKPTNDFSPENNLLNYLQENKPSLPYHTSDILLQAEVIRIASEYGELVNMMTLKLDGYEINQTKLSSIMEETIDRKIDEVLQPYNNNKYIIIIEGHTCDLGSAAYNLRLARQRAVVVRDFLIKNGFNRSNLIVTSKGKTAPIVPSINEAHRKVNRRVVLLVKEK